MFVGYLAYLNLKLLYLLHSGLIIIRYSKNFILIELNIN